MILDFTKCEKTLSMITFINCYINLKYHCLSFYVFKNSAENQVEYGEFKDMFGQESFWSKWAL